MKIHEYQAKELFKQGGIPVSTGEVAATSGEAEAIAKRMGLPVVIKAQVHVGGRGKAGGVKVVDKMEDVKPAAEKILGLTIKDLPVRKVLVAKAVDIQTEVYLSVLIDRDNRKIVFVGSAEGGIDIEETAKTNPEKIHQFECEGREVGDLEPGALEPFAARLFSQPKHIGAAVEIMQRMGKLFKEKDASLIEINPLIIDGDGDVVALDAKMILDDNGLFRHPELEELRDLDAEDADELKAKEAGLSFIRLDGAIGCMVNGAGLAMATMDTIKHYGGEPANFLDVGGSSDPDKVVAAFELILKDKNVKVILVNIFGGITRCDDIAKGIVTAFDQMDISVPIIVRLIGTNEEEGRKILENTPLTAAESLEAAATEAAKVGGAK